MTMRATSLLVVSLATLAFVPLLVAGQEGTPTHKPGGFHSPEIQPGGFWDLRLSASGTYYYHCHPHPFMRGIIVATEDESPQTRATVEAVNFKFAPETLRVRPNTTITFQNKDNVVHTVDESIPPPQGANGGDSPAIGAPLVLAALLAWVLLRRRQ